MDMNKYNLQKLKEALEFNAVEVIPGQQEILDKELEFIIEKSQKSGEPIKHYIGFEISGKIHIGTGIMSALKIKKLQEAGVECNIFLADYHTWLNEKLDGKIETIRSVARNYFAPVMLECCKVVGCDMKKLNIIFAEDLYESSKNGQSFWNYDMVISKKLSLSRVLKSISITGKESGGEVDFGTLRYAPMQVSDCFFMGTHIVHAGMDQRKVHVLMRETAPKLDYEFTLKIGGKPIKPLATHHGLLLGMKKESGAGGEVVLGKMSKSKPETCVFVHDTPQDIEKKIKKAYCPLVDTANQTTEEIEQEQKNNPMLNWLEIMIFPAGRELRVIRPVTYGGDKTYSNYDDLKQDYFSGQLHPGDLKNAIALNLIEWFEPIKDYIDNNPESLKYLE